MRYYDVEITYRHNGTKYDRTDRVLVESSSVRAAIGQALGPKRRKNRLGWREPAGAVFKIQVIVGGIVNKQTGAPVPTGREERENDQESE